MSDWDDDDFGGFESADVNNARDVPAEGDVAAVDLADANSSNSGTSNVAVLDWILSNTPKSSVSSADPETASSVPEDSQKLQALTAEATGQDVSSSLSLEEIMKKFPSESTEHGGSLNKNIAAGSVALANVPVTDWSKEFLETKDKIQSSTVEEPEVKKEVVDNAAIHKLQSELDAATLMKEQTEKSLEKLQKELEELTDKSKNDLEEKARRHEDEVSQLKQQHKDEMDELQRISEQTMKQLTNQYSEIWKMIEKDKSIELETTANSVTEKCLELMKQQHDVLSQKLEESKLSQEKDFKKSMESEQEILSENIQKKLGEGKCNLEDELNKKLTEKLDEDAKKLQEVHTETLKEAMSKQQAHFEDTLRSTLAKEREKFSETLKDAVKEAQITTEKEMERKMKLEENRLKAHNLSLKMLLSSALQQLDRQFPGDAENSEICLEKT